MPIGTSSHTFRTSLTALPADATNFPLWNIPQIIEHRFNVLFTFDFNSSVTEQVIISSPAQLTVLSGDWQGKGVVIGDSLTITATIDGASNINATGTVQDIQGNELFFTTSIFSTSEVGLNFPQAPDNGVMTISNNTRDTPEVLEIFYNMIENSASFNLDSLLDGEVNRFRVTIPTTDSTVPFEQLGNKSGGGFIDADLSRITAGPVTIFSCRFKYFNWLAFEDANFDEPDWFSANNSLKPVLRVKGFPVFNNPNSFLDGQYMSQNGNIGRYGENYNQGINDYTLNSVVYENLSGDVIPNIDHGQTTVVRVSATSATGTPRNYYEAELLTLPPTNNWKNNEYSNAQNTYRSHLFWDGSTDENINAAKLGASVTMEHVSVNVSGNNIEFVFRIIPNSVFTNFIDSLQPFERLFSLVCCVQDVGGDSNEFNNVALVLGQSAFESQPIQGQVLNTNLLGFYPHSQDISGSITPIYNGCTEDDFLYRAKLNLSKNEVIDTIKTSIQVVRDSDNLVVATLEDYVFNTSNVVMLNGVLQLNEFQSLNQFLDAPNRNSAQITLTGNETSNDYEIDIIISLIANWRYWQAQNNNVNDFFDLSLPNNGQNREWMRYLRLPGYSLRARTEIIKNNVADYFDAEIQLQDYEDNLTSPTVNTTISIIDTNGDAISAIPNNQELIFRADHVLLSGAAWDVNDTYGFNMLRAKEQDPRPQITTVWAWTTQNSPLQPLTGETEAQLTFPAPDTARIENRFNSSMLQDGEHTFVSRIESPINPECILPLTWLFDTMETFGGTQREKFEFFVQLARTGELSANGLCCADCDISESPSPIYKGMAFGSLDVTTNDLPTIWTAPFCCHDIYLGDGGCTATFDAQIDAIFAGIDGDLTAFEGLNVPTQANPFGGANWELLGQKIFDFTTDEVLRYDMVSYFILNGIAIYCDPSGATIFQTLNVT